MIKLAEGPDGVTMRDRRWAVTVSPDGVTITGAAPAVTVRKLGPVLVHIQDRLGRNRPVSLGDVQSRVAAVGLGVERDM